MNYEESARLVPEALTQDTLWKVEAYRLAVFLADIGWNDVTRLLGDKEPSVGLTNSTDRSAQSVPTWRKVTGEAQTAIVHASMNMVSVLLGKAATGTTKGASFSVTPFLITALLF